MDVTTLVMTAAHLHGIHATGAVECPTLIPGVTCTAITWPDAQQAATFTAACMADGVPARNYGLIDGEHGAEHTVVVLH